MRFKCFCTMLALLVLATAADAQVRMSFVGPNDPNPPVPVGSFDETVDDVFEICLPCLVAPDGEYKIRFTAWNHWRNDYPGLPDSEPLIPGTGWRCLAVMQPGDVVVGYAHSGDSYPWHWVAGDTWNGYVPSDFTHLNVVFYSPEGTLDNNVYGWVHTFTVPVVWTSDPVPVDDRTWSGIKSQYK